MTTSPSPEQNCYDRGGLVGGGSSRPHPGHCPAWCCDCTHHEFDPPGAITHKGSAIIATLYDEYGLLAELHIRAVYWDKPQSMIGTDPADLEVPFVEVRGPGSDDVHFDLSPVQARAFAVALLQAADTADRQLTLTPLALDSGSRTPGTGLPTSPA